MWISAIVCAFGGYQGWSWWTVPAWVVVMAMLTVGIRYGMGINLPSLEMLGTGAVMTLAVNIVTFSVGRGVRRVLSKMKTRKESDVLHQV